MRSLLVGIVVSIPTIAASSVAQPLTVERFIERVAQGPAAEEIDRRLEVARGAARGAGLWPNPSVSWNREHLPGANVAQSTQDIVWISAPLVLSGRTFVASDAAEDDVEAARLTRIGARARLRRDAAVLFHRALAAQRRGALMTEVVERYREVLAIVEQRADAGEASGYEALRLEVARARAQDDASGATLAVLAAKSEMQRLADADVGALAGTLDEAPSEVAAESTTSPMSAQLRALELRVRAAKARADASSRRAVPDPIVSGGIQRQGGGGGESFFGYFVGVQIPLPLFDRGQGASSESSAIARRIDVERTKLVRAAQVSLAEASQRWKTSVERLSAQRRASEAAASMVRVAREGYLLGGVALLALLDAEQSALQVRLRVVERALDVKIAAADVRFLTGGYDEGDDR